MADGQPPLSWDCSSTTNPTVSDTLPDEVVACLKNARFLHLATCSCNTPHVSLMNYTYLPPDVRPPTNSSRPSQIPAGPTVIMTSNPSSKKAVNLRENPNVSLLVHDWVSARPPNAGAEGGAPRSMLQNMLMQINSAAVSNISTTIEGRAHMLTHGTPEEQWCKDQHLANNTFGDDVHRVRALSAHRLTHAIPTAESGSDPTRLNPTAVDEDDDVRVFVVQIHGGRISDSKGTVKDWAIRVQEPRDLPMANGH